MIFKCYPWVLQRLKRIYYRCTTRLVNKLILLFASIIILVVVSLTCISNQMIEKESVSSNISSNTNNLMLVNKNMVNYFSEINQLTLPNYQFDQMMNALMTGTDDYFALTYLENYLRELFYSNKDIEGIYMHIIHEQKVLYISRHDPDIRVRLKSDTLVPSKSWFREALQSPYNKSMQSLLVPADLGYDVDLNQSFMTFHRVLRNLSDKDPKAIVTFVFNSNVLNGIAEDMPVNDGEYVLLLNKENEPFYYKGIIPLDQVETEAFLEQMELAKDEGQFTWSIDKEQYLVIFNTIRTEEGNEWKFIKQTPYDEIYQAAKTNRIMGYSIGASFFVIALILVILVSNAIIRPIKQLSRKMNRFSEGNFNVVVEVNGYDEIAHLSRKFNMMVSRTNDLINERYKMKLAEKNAILKALEAEINPHFLYNALQAISTKAIKNDIFEIADMVDALALTLRYCISGSDMVPLQNEMRHIEQYLILQKARFGDRLQVEYQIDERSLELMIPKLLIQTLVENAIKHALEQISTAITIIIQVRIRYSNIEISVFDNGPGISPDRLSVINQMLEEEWNYHDGECIGLKNLNTRIKLIYGDAACLIIQTDPCGTEMCIRIPMEGRDMDV